VAPVLGRALVEADLEPGAQNVAVVSHRFWTRELNADPRAAGRRMTINGELFTIAGVAPAGFAGLLGSAADVWVPLRPTASLRPWDSRSASAQAPFTDGTWWWTTIAARLKPGVTKEQARAETEPLFHQAITAGVTKLPSPLPGLDVSSAGPVFDNYRKRYALSLRILLLTAGLVLLIACTNLAALLTARARARQKEMAIRLSIGASRGRIAAQLLTESLLLAAAGGALGLLLALRLGPALLELLLGETGGTPINVAPDPAVLVCSGVVSNWATKKLKERLTYRRTGWVEMTEPGRGVRLVAAGLAVVSAGGLAAMIVTGKAEGMEHTVTPAIGLVLSLSFVVASVRQKAPHMLALAVVALVLGMSFGMLKLGWGSLSWMFLWLGVAAAVVGGWRLSSYLKAHPAEGVE
jgi:hypothetical protein